MERGRDSWLRRMPRAEADRSTAFIGGRSPCADMPDPRRRTDQGVPDTHGELPVLPAVPVRTGPMTSFY